MMKLKCTVHENSNICTNCISYSTKCEYFTSRAPHTKQKRKNQGSEPHQQQRCDNASVNTGTITTEQRQNEVEKAVNSNTPPVVFFETGGSPLSYVHVSGVHPSPPATTTSLPEMPGIETRGKRQDVSDSSPAASSLGEFLFEKAIDDKYKFSTRCADQIYPIYVFAMLKYRDRYYWHPFGYKLPRTEARDQDVWNPCCAIDRLHGAFRLHESR